MGEHPLVVPDASGLASTVNLGSPVFLHVDFSFLLRMSKGTLLLFVFSDNQKHINVYAVCQKYIKHYQCWGGRLQPELDSSS